MDDLLRLEETCRQARLTLAAQQNAGMLFFYLLLVPISLLHWLLAALLDKVIRGWRVLRHSV